MSLLSEPVGGVMLGSGAVLATASVTADQLDIVKFGVGSVVFIVGLTVGFIAWQGKQTKKAIKEHERVELERDRRRHEEIMSRLTMLIQRLVDLKIIPEHTQSGSWMLQPSPPHREDDTGEL
jgi:hypothetical protein